MPPMIGKKGKLTNCVLSKVTPEVVNTSALKNPPLYFIMVPAAYCSLGAQLTKLSEIPPTFMSAPG